MSSPAITTLTKMIETLPESAQDQAVEHMRNYIADLQDEMHWNTLYEETKPQLVKAAQNARKEILAGKAAPMDLNQL